MTHSIRSTISAPPWAAALPLLLAALLWAASAHARGTPESFADLAEELLPTVVNIATSQVVETTEGGEEFEDFFRDFFERRGQRPQQRFRWNAWRAD